ncbi:MAG: T9SS type A sorting domain-containing protein [candidate division WOR-3 bacterium]
MLLLALLNAPIATQETAVDIEVVESWAPRPLPPADNPEMPADVIPMPDESMRSEDVPAPDLDYIPGASSGVWMANEDLGGEAGTYAYVSNSWQGTVFTGYIPPDVQMAVGPNHIVELVNCHIRILDKSTGSTLYYASYYTFLGIPNTGTNIIFDPRVAYDINRGRWIISLDYLNDISGNDTSQYILCYSQTSDPTGPWGGYRINAEVGDSLWLDYPMLGFNDWGIFLTGNLFGNISFRYGDMLILDKDSIYAGAASLYGSRYLASGGNFSQHFAFTMRGCATAFDCISNTGSDNRVWIRKVYGPATSPTIGPWNTITVAPYNTPTPGRQLGPNDNIDPGDCRLQDVTYKDGRLYMTFGERYNWGSGNSAAIRYLEIDTTWSVIRDITYGSDATDYYYGRVSPDDQCITMVFTRSSNSEYAGVYLTTKQTIASSFEPATQLKAGEINYYLSDGSRNRWGDYSGAYMDPAGSAVWVAGEYAYNSSGNGRWGTWLARVSCLGVGQKETASYAGPGVIFPYGNVFSGVAMFRLLRYGRCAIYDAQGRLTTSLEGPGNVNLPMDPGVYFLKLGTENHRLVVVR